MKKFLGICLISFMGFHNGEAQSTLVGGVFPTIDFSGSITKKLDYSFYYFGAFPLLTLKHSEFYDTPVMLLFYSEQALTFNPNKQLSFTGSYVYQREKGADHNYINENRLFLQAAFKHSLQAVNFKHRLRFDNRFIHDRVRNETPNTHRLRYLIGLDFPIKSKGGDLYFAAYEEVFLNTFKNATAVYAENWSYMALGIRLNGGNKMEAGPLYITWKTAGGNWFHQVYLQMTWISQLGFFYQNKKM
jgi:hypothetical protein